MDKKKRLMLEIEEIERALIDLHQWKAGSKITKFTEKITGPINNIEQCERMINLLKGYILSKRNEKNTLDNDKLYLTEIVKNEKPNFGQNNLILAPVGSGKSELIKQLIKHDKVLLLVSTTSLKDKLVPRNEEDKVNLGSRMYTTKNNDVYGEGEQRILVMTYSEFGEKIKYEDSFALEFPQIFCDEMHSLPYYHSFSNAPSLLGAIKYLFSKHENQEKFYFTATIEHLDALKKENEKIFNNVKVFNYLKYPNIKRYMPLSSYSITGIEQVRSHLRARKESFKYFDYKMFAFCKTISSLLRLGKIAEEEGFKPLILWSINNEDHTLSEEQVKNRDYVLSTGLIPDGYDILIVNSAMQEGWDLIDPRVKLAIMNTTNETELVQATGRIRKDIDVLVYRVNSGNPDYIVNIPTELLDIHLNSEMKEQLVDSLNIYDTNNRKVKWPTIKQLLKKQGFIVEDKMIREDGKQKRISIISLEK